MDLHVSVLIRKKCAHRSARHGDKKTTVHAPAPLQANDLRPLNGSMCNPTLKYHAQRSALHRLGRNLESLSALVQG